MKNLTNIFRSLFLAPFIIFVFNKMAIVLDIFIPINIGTVLIVGFLGFPGLVALIIVYFMIL